MALVELKNLKNEKVGEIELNDAIISYPVKPWLMHEVVVKQLADKRAGTHATKNRAKITGGGRKPWKQKGTGRARAGSIRSPLWRGGATIFGPQPRDYSISMPKKKMRNALKSAFRAKLEDGSIEFLENLNIESGKTKDAALVLKSFGADRRVLLVFDELEDTTIRAFRNIENVKILHLDGLNVYDLINADKIFILQSCLPKLTEVLSK
ncbi:MAG: large subunit ribosomal protein [Deferribacteres bacterium]|jgi:large subunit ribosomal protein L4|nr:rplD [Deferribacteraceae bacterium]MDK2791963.1 large subunit ribosomal protein [Deferribacteres bacterium]